MNDINLAADIRSAAGAIEDANAKATAYSNLISLAKAVGDGDIARIAGAKLNHWFDERAKAVDELNELLKEQA